MAAEAEEEQKKAVEEVGSAYKGVGIGSGWEVSEGKAMRMVEITTHFWMAVTEEEKNKLPEKVGVVADQIGAKRQAEGRGVWAIKAAVDTQVCNNEITWTLSKVLKGTMEEEVRKTLHDMVAVAYGQEKLRDTWVTNRKSIAVFIRNLRGGAGDKREEFTGKLKVNNSTVKWGKRAAVVLNLTPVIWGMKAEVESAEEAVKVIAQGV